MVVVTWSPPNSFLLLQQFLRRAQRQHNPIEIEPTIVRIVRAISQSVQPSPIQKNKNPPPLLASIVENDERRIIMIALNENVDTGIMMKVICQYSKKI